MNGRPITNNNLPVYPWIDRIIFGCILFILIFPPLSFGAVHVWSQSLIEITVFLFIGVLLIGRLLTSTPGQFTFVRTPINIFYLMFVSLILIQLLPLPEFLIKWVSPHTFADKMNVLKLFAKETNTAEEFPVWFCLSYYAYPAINELLKILAYGGLFFLAINTIRTKKQINTIIWFLIGIGVFQSLYAVYQVFGDDPRIWWWKSRFGIMGRGSGTFIGANHFAGYLEMIIPLTIGFMLCQTRTSKRFLPGLKGARSFFQRVLAWFDPDSTHPIRVLLFFCILVMLLGLLLSGSRGGILSAGMAIGMLAGMFFFTKRLRQYWVLPFIVMTAALAFGWVIGLDNTIERFKHPEDLESRLSVNDSILPMIADYPVFGVGLGNFRYVYPRYIQEKDQVSDSGHAHNDWGEVSVETGVTGLALIVSGFGLFLFNLFRTWRKRRDTHAIVIGAGVLAGMVSLGMHSFFDFNMHVPANPLTLSALMAIGFLAVYRRGSGYEERFFYKVIYINFSQAGKAIFSGIVICILGFCITVSGAHVIAEAYCPSEWNSTLNLNWKPRISQIRKAAAFNPFNADYYYKEASVYAGFMELDEGVRKKYRDRTIEKFQQAIRLNPVNAQYWKDLAGIYSFGSDDALSYITERLPLADYCYDRAVEYAPKDKDILFEAGRYWVWRSTIVSETDETHNDGNAKLSPQKTMIHKFQSHFQAAIESECLKNNYKITEEQFLHHLYTIADEIWIYYPDEGIVLGSIPDKRDELKRRILRYLADKKDMSGS